MTFDRWLAAGIGLVWSFSASAQSPDSFSFIERTGVATNVFVTSEAVTLQGYEGTLPISVADGQYSIDNGAFTSTSGTIAAGSRLRLRHVSASSAETATETVVTVGGGAARLRSLTSSLDRTPDPFDFGVLAGRDPGVPALSAPRMLAGFNTGIALQSGGGLEYRIDDGAFTAAAGTLQPGHLLTVRHTASTQPLAYTKSWLKAGNVTGWFTTRTRAANSLPDADGDGIPDTTDVCPGTAPGEPANASGCSAAQRDSDGDRVSDALDRCAGTPAGYAVDADGCSLKLCREAAAATAGACFTATATRLRDCYASDGHDCAGDDAALRAPLASLRDSVASACGTPAMVRGAGFGARETGALLGDSLVESCEGNARTLLWRSFGGPQAKVRNAAVAAGKTCLDAAYAEARALISSLAASYGACATDAACDGAARVAQEPVAALQAQARIAAACAAQATTLKDELGTPEDLFVARAARQAHCLVVEALGDAGSVPLACGPDDARFAGAAINGPNKQPLAGGLDAIPRATPIQVVLDPGVWGARCGDGSPYAFWIKLAPEGQPIDRIQLMLQGGGACLTPADCAVYADSGKFTSLNDGNGMVVLRSDDPRNPLRNWSQVVLPYCTQDLHLGGGTVEPYANNGDPAKSGVLYRYGAVNVRAAFEFVRDLLWRRLREERPESYRPDLLQAIFTGNSAGGYGVHYNYHYPLDELRWANTLAHPHASLIIDGATLDVGLLMKAKADTWNVRPFLPSYCHFDECALSRFHLPAYAERIDARHPFQHYAVSISQHDPSGESQQFRGDPPAGWINGARKLYCDLKNAATPHMNFFLPVPKDGVPQHGFLDEEIFDRDSALSKRMSADGINVVDWLAGIVADPKTGYDAVEENRLVEFVQGVKPFVAFGCAVDGEDPNYQEPPAPPLLPGDAGVTGPGCTVLGQAGAGATNQTCSYLAGGPGTYRAATPSLWRITARRNGETVTLAMGSNPTNVGGGDPKVGVLASQAGDVVTVTLVANPNFAGTQGAVSAGGVIGVPTP